jgi:drug/metabolite transporter (DMT)-like permease
MDTSLFLLKFWGWYCVIFFFILCFNPKRIKQIIEDLQDEKFTILISFLAIIIGLLNILFHNIWEANIRLVVTLFGWLALLKGIMLLTFPRTTTKGITKMNIKFVQAMYFFVFLIGVLLLNEAYGIVPF